MDYVEVVEGALERGEDPDEALDRLTREDELQRLLRKLWESQRVER